MNPDNTVEYNSLSWVKPQLDDVLLDAQSNLNDYIENKEPEHLENCIEHLQLIFGTLQMVEVYGAAMLAEEMQKTTAALLHGKIEHEEDAFDVLMRAMLQLPDYLERVQAGGVDSPIKLMQLFNDLRAVRKEGLLSESVLFSPEIVNITLPATGYDENAIKPGRLQGEVKRLRTHYQLGMLDYIRNKKERAGLQRIKAVLHSLEKVSVHPEVRHLWIVTGALAEGLLKQGIETNLSIKVLLGSIDRQLKVIMDVGEQRYASLYSKELVKNCLYYVGLSTVDTRTISAIKNAYHLNDLIPQESADAHSTIGGLNADLFDTVSKGISEDLNKVKDILELYMHGSEKELPQLVPVAQQLGKIADTYGMLGLGATRQSILEQRDVLQNVIDNEAELSEPVVLNVAEKLLTAESELKDFIASRSGFVDLSHKTGYQNVPPAEYRQVVFTVVTEGLKNFSEAKEAILSYVAGNGDSEQLEIILQRLEEVRGVAMMLPLGRVEKLIADLQTYVRIALLENKRQPDGIEQDSVADVVTAIEYFFEALSEGRPGVEQGLNTGEAAVNKLLEITQGYIETDHENVAQAVTEQAVDAEVGDTEAEEPVSVDAVVTESIDVPDVEATESEIDELVTDEPEVAAIDTEQSQAEPPQIDQPEAKVEPQYKILAEDADEEIVEIFIEEAVEVLGDLHSYVPQWKENNNDEEALAVIRRGFHTLKGSGRLLGAELIGEFSWKFENMLNRVIENKIIVSDDLFDVLEDALNVLPQLIEQLDGNREPIANIAQLMSSAEAIAEGRAIVKESATTAELEKVNYNLESTDTDLESTEGVSAGFEEESDNVEISVSDDLMDDELDELNEFISSEETTVLEGSDNEIIDIDYPAEEIDELEVSEQEVSEQDALEDDALDISTLAEELVEEEGIEEGSEAVIEENIIELEEDETGIDEIDLTDDQDITDEIIDIPSESETSEDELEFDIEQLDIEEVDTIPLSAEASEETSLETDSDSDREEEILSAATEDTTDTEVVELQEEISDSDEVLFTGNNFDDDQVQVSEVDDTSESESDADDDTIDLSADISADSTDENIDEFADELAGDDELLEDQIGFSETTDISSSVNADNKENDNVEISLDDKLDIDPELLRIYHDESMSHLQSIRQLIDEAHSTNQPLETGKTLMRNFHTLYGSARTAEVEAIADLSGAAEKYIKAHQEDVDKSIPSDTVAVLSEIVQTITQMLSLVAEGRTPLHDKDLQEKISRIVQQEIQAQLQKSWQDNSSLIEEYGQQGLSDVANDAEIDISELDTVEQDNPDADTESVVPDQAEQDVVPVTYGDIDDELIDIFLEEAEELLESCEDVLIDIKNTPNATEHIQKLQRNMHTLKGGARMAELTPIGDLTHNLESLVVMVADKKIEADKFLFDLLQESLDALTTMLNGVKKRQALITAGDLIGRVERLMRGEVVEKRAVERFDVDMSDIESTEDVDIADLISEFEQTENVTNLADYKLKDEAVTEETTAPAKKPEPHRRKADKQVPHWGERTTDVNYRDSQEQVRVRADLLNNLVNYAGEVNIYHARMGKQVSDFSFNLSELTQTVVRLKDQLRNLEIETEIQIRSGYEKESVGFDENFDPLEMDQYSTLQQLTRSLSETAGDVDSINTILTDITRDSETLLLQESRVSTDLQEGLMRTRMVRFGGLTSRLRRIVRQISRELGKEVTVEIEGETSEIDRTVLDRIIAPLEHMLRNAVAHGIETPEQRKASGKNETGSILIEVGRQGTDVLIKIKDDGAGINTTKIREKAIAHGYLSKDSDISDHDVLQFILQSGLSTADEVTQVAGRGVGMDVVDSEIKQLGGVLDISSTPGQGTEFNIRLPLTLAINQALLVSVADEAYAVPLASIEGVVRITGLELQRFYDSENSHYEFNGVNYELKHLGGMLTGNQGDYSKQLRLFPVLLVHVGDQHFALHVDDLIGRREIVVKPVGMQIGSVRGIAGATILADGRVVLILEMSALVIADSLFKPRAVIEVEEIEPEVPVETRKTVMVVDDSITIRKVTERILLRHGMDVVLAKDGVDATNLLQDRIPDLMLLDIEMPRMDGFEVASFVRNDSRLRNIPIIMITSRTGSKHKEKAMNIGVNRYLGKPFQEDDLMKNINEILQTAN